TRSSGPPGRRSETAQQTGSLADPCRRILPSSQDTKAHSGEAAARGGRRTRAVASCLPPESITAGQPRHLHIALALPRCAVRVLCAGGQNKIKQKPCDGMCRNGTCLETPAISARRQHT